MTIHFLMSAYVLYYVGDFFPDLLWKKESGWSPFKNLDIFNSHFYSFVLKQLR